MKLNKALQLLLVSCAFSVAANASTIFNFDTDNFGTSTNFTDTVDGLSATFSSAADPGGFVVYSSIFETLTGNVLGDPGPAGLDGLALTINFSQDLSAVVLDFATSDFSTPSPLTLTAYENASLVGSNTSSGQFLPGFTFPEGEIAFDGATFNQLVISSTAMDFAVDNITVATAPEPTSIALLSISLLALGIPRLRRKAQPEN
jgi:hypothetical protein